MSGEPTATRSISDEHRAQLESFLPQMYAQAAAEFPSECCGYVLGEGANAVLAQCVNRQDKLHALDPQAHPRTSANGYNIGGKDLLTLARSFESDAPATVIYHSHPRVGAYFSDEDTAAAISAGYAVDYLVIDALEDRVAGAILFRREGDRYVEILRFGDPGGRRD